jgi:hypothetical protein
MEGLSKNDRDQILKGLIVIDDTLRKIQKKGPKEFLGFLDFHWHTLPLDFTQNPKKWDLSL